MYCKRIFVVVVSLSFSLFIAHETKVSAKSDLKIEGTVLGYNLTAKNLNSTFIFASNVLLVKVSKILKGKEKSEYLIVRFRGSHEDYVVSAFGVDKTLNFRLERERSCDETLNDLETFQIKNGDGLIVETLSSLVWVANFEKEMLPSKKVLPCYFVSKD